PAAPATLAHLLLVDNPAHHPLGDFALDAQGRLHADGETRLTFSGIGVFRPDMLRDWPALIGDAPGAREQPPRFKLAAVLRATMMRGAVSATHHRGAWTDVGTPARLAGLQAALTR